MKKIKDNKNTYLRTAPVFLLVFFLCIFIGFVVVQNRMNNEKEQIERLILEHNNRLRDVISKQLHMTHALGALIIRGDGTVDDFQRTAAVLAVELPTLANFLLAPDGVVTDVYPLEGNEAVIGLEFFDEEGHAGNKEAILARDTGELVMAGPFMLRQGIVGLTGRYPVFIDTDTGESVFWGLVSVSLKFPEALGDVGLNMLDSQGFYYELWRIDPDTLEKQIIAENSEYSNTDTAYLEKSVNIFNAEWYFRIYITSAWYDYPETWISFLIALSMSLFIAFILQSRNTAQQHASRLSEATQAKSKFLAFMSHEMRTPLNAIIGISDIELESDNNPTDVLDAFGRINNSGRTLLGIINDILDLSKVETGKLDIVPDKYDILSLINDTARLNVMLIGEKPVEFKIKAAETLPSMLIGDELRIKQILNNILSNSIKYTDEGTVTLEVDSESNEDEIYLVFTIKDTGLGMTPDQLSALYDEYTMFTQEADHKLKGTGLGMSITKRLVEMMSGRIEAESEPGVGSVFKVYLLQQRADSEPIGKKLAENISSFMFKHQASRAKPEREYMPYGSVLIVDDLDANLFVAKKLMDSYGLEIDTAISGYKVLDKIRAGEKYDIIFMDHMMPGMDGIETTKILREEGYKLPVVALTANAIVSMKEVFFDNGFDDFVSKPIDIRQLDHVLNIFIRDKKPHDVVEKARKEKEARSLQVPQNGNCQRAQECSRISDCPWMSGKNNCADLMDRFKEISSLNVDSALRKMNGMENVYIDSVKLVSRMLPGRIEKMDMFINSNLRYFTIEVHGLKSILRNIGADTAGNNAEDLEKTAFDNDVSYCNEKYPAFRADLVELSNSLNEILQGKSADSKEKADKSSIAAIINEVKTATESFDSILASELLTPCADYSYDDEIDELLEKIILSLDASDYDGAISEIEKLEKILHD